MCRQKTFAFTLVLLFLPSVAWAEENNERLASQEFERGERLYRAEDFLGCARHFEKAFTLAPQASVHYNIAKCYEMADLGDLAAQHYRAFLDARAGRPERRAKVRESLDRLSGELGWVRVTTRPAGATISADDRERGRAPLLLALTKGPHTIEAKLGESRAISRVTVGNSEQSLDIPIEQAGVEEENPPLTEPVVEPLRQPSTPQVVETGRAWQRLPHGLFWAGLVLTLSSAGALLGCGLALLSTEEYFLTLEEGDPDFQPTQERGVTLERLTTTFWATTGVITVITTLFAVFTNWHALKRDTGNEGSSRLDFRLSVGQGASLEMTF